MKSIAQGKNIILLVILTIIAFVFIGASVWLVNTVNEKRSNVEKLVGQVSIIAGFEAKLLDCIEHSENDRDGAFQLSIDEIAATDFMLDEFPELTELSSRTKDLHNYFNVSGIRPSFQPFQRSLQELFDFSIDEKNKKRRELGMLSMELGDYWSYTHLLIALACFLSIVLAFIGWVVFRSRKKYTSLKTRNAQYLNGIVDCVIVCDNNGNVVEYNAAAAKTFGFDETEAIGMPIRDIYTNESDWKKVRNSLDVSEYFKGEVVNKKKNGELFLSFLSANLVYDESGKKVGSMGISRDISKQKTEEEQFQHIVNNATDIIYTTNVDGEVTYVNTSANNILGYSNEQIIGMSFKDLIHPDYLDIVEGHYATQFRNRDKGTSYLEFQMLKENGDPIWIGQNVRTTFSQIDENRIVGFFGILRDLDEVKKVELELSDSEAKFRELFDNSKDLIQSVDANGMILYVNQAWKNTLGYNDEDLREMNLFDIIHQDSRDYSEELLSEILKSGSNEDDSREHLFRMVTKSGEFVMLQGTVSVKYENELVKSLQTFFRDVTDHHKIEEELKKSQENFKLISSSINDVFFLYNSVLNKYDYISPNCEEVLGVKPEFFLNGGKYSETHAHPGDIENIEELNTIVKSGESGQVEYRRLIEDGRNRWIEEKWFPIKNERGETVNISGVCRDVTDMKEAYNIIFEQNREISQSILYAKNIQESTLPTTAEVADILPQAFVFYKAKDVLSGDLYIVDKVKGNSGEVWPAFIVGDCTGHGVPGGLLSLLCSGLLTESLTNINVNSPAEALGLVREKLIRLFRSNPTKYILDGMDAAFCVLNRKDKEIYFAGANLSCYIVRGGEVIEYKGDRQAIGYSSSMEPFVHFSIDIEENDNIYLTTDGYVDQFGGEKNKKFLKKRLSNLLIEIADMPMDEQRNKIEKTFEDWKGPDGDQTDDIAMIGVRI